MLNITEGQLIKVRKKDIHPTQFAIGKRAAKEKTKKVQRLYNRGTLDDYRQIKIVPLVKGPDQNLYMFDRHHTSYAFFKADIPKYEKFLYGRIDHDLSHLDSMRDFWHEMEKNNWAYLYDNGVKRPGSEVPRKVTKLNNDPYRSLAWLLREEGYIIKEDIPFMEFKWADFFRKNGVLLEQGKKKKWKKAFKRGIELTRSPEASDLPGYVGNAK